ncbi:hypothetical protein ACLGEG_03930 [Helicobacter pylori]
MRQKNETATSFNQLKEITEIMQKKTPTPKSDNTNTSEIAHQSVQKPKGAARAKNHALKPTKRAFSERQNTAFRDNSQESDEKRLKTKNKPTNKAITQTLLKAMKLTQGGNNEA